MSKALLLSIVFVPVLLGMRAARGRLPPRRALARLLLQFVLFALGYAAFLKYVYLRIV